MDNTDIVCYVTVHCERVSVDILNVQNIFKTSDGDLIIESLNEYGAEISHNFATGKWVYFVSGVGIPADALQQKV